MLLAFYKPTTWKDRLVCWFTDKKYSHVSIEFSNGDVVEASPKYGVRKVGLIEEAAVLGDVIDFYEITVDCDEAKVRKFVNKQIGKPYDWPMVIRFVIRKGRDKPHDKSWFCSELVYSAIEAGGVKLLDNIEAWKVTPGELAQSPLLRQITSMEMIKLPIE